ncbi:unnamed protein product [Protopolystoma xenopodis]|uniref:Transcription initiation factor TFIID subunit 8 n=1 Tax=Protopolystoma xenopodis TaxID=117903 RepID=A0A3S5FDA1_9PLAT|nr:unnamed protein product [Protopolystoma xenopodis]
MMSTRVITGSEIPQGLSDVLESAVGYSALLTGFSTIEYAALRSLSGLILSFMEDIAIKSLSYAESSGRVRIIPLDLALAFADSGISISSLINLPKRRQYRGFKEPLAIADSAKLGVVQTSLLGPTGAIIIPRPLGIRNQVSTSQTPGPVWIASSTSIASTPSSHLPPSPSYLRLPPAPEPHTFLATRVTRPPPAPDIATLRRRAAEQLKQVQFSLIRFLARVNPVYHLFPDDAESFPSIKRSLL